MLRPWRMWTTYASTPSGPILYLGCIDGIFAADARLPNVLQPYCNLADTHWYAMDKAMPPDHRKPHKQADYWTHQDGLERAQANS